MKPRSLLMAAASMALLAVTLYAAEKINLEGVKCIVGKRAAKAGTEVDYKGGKVFFCCDNCPKAFAKDTEKFATKANAQLVATKQAKQAKCPISGRPCKVEHKVKVADLDVYFCCPNCKGKVAEAEGDDQLKLVFSDKAFDKAFIVGEKKKDAQ